MCSGHVTFWTKVKYDWIHSFSVEQRTHTHTHGKDKTHRKHDLLEAWRIRERVEGQRFRHGNQKVLVNNNICLIGLSSNRKDTYAHLLKCEILYPRWKRKCNKSCEYTTQSCHHFGHCFVLPFFVLVSSFRSFSPLCVFHMISWQLSLRLFPCPESSSVLLFPSFLTIFTSFFVSFPAQERKEEGRKTNRSRARIGVCAVSCVSTTT